LSDAGFNTWWRIEILLFSKKSRLYNCTTGGRKENKSGIEGVEVLVVVDTPRQEDFGGTGFLQGHKRGDIQKDQGTGIERVEKQL
jgi:hypothetical protein